MEPLDITDLIKAEANRRYPGMDGAKEQLAFVYGALAAAELLGAYMNSTIKRVLPVKKS